jgi:hypothetical protein
LSFFVTATAKILTKIKNGNNIIYDGNDISPTIVSLANAITLSTVTSETGDNHFEQIYDFESDFLMKKRCSSHNNQQT